METHLRMAGPLRPSRWVMQQVRALTGHEADLSRFEQPAGDVGWYGPDSVIWQVHAHFVAMMVGGIGSLAGSVVGGIFYVLVDNSAQAISTFVKNDLGVQFDLSAYTIFGLLLIALMYIMPMGIVGGVYLALRRLRR